MLTFPQPTCFGGMCTIAPQDDWFGHHPMTLTELVPHLRVRAERTTRLDYTLSLHDALPIRKSVV